MGPQRPARRQGPRDRNYSADSAVTQSSLAGMMIFSPGMNRPNAGLLALAACERLERHVVQVDQLERNVAGHDRV